MGLFTKIKEEEILPIVTIDNIPGKKIIELKGMISVTSVNHDSDCLIGNRFKLSEAARKIGANAIVGVSKTEFSYFGTAVIVADIDY